MSAEFFRIQRLSLPPDEFRRLPRNAAYKYELLEGEAWLSPRPRYQHALLDLASFVGPPADELPRDVSLRRLRESDWAELPDLFAAAFRLVQPYGSLDEAARREAAVKCLDQTRTGGDGPLLESACHVAVSRERSRVEGVILLTFIPLADLSDPDASARWEGPTPPDAIKRGLGRPHLTWIFVSPFDAGHGIGTALLSAAVRELTALGFTDLATTFLVGNDQSMLWHWRNGFRLLAHPGSRRERRRRWK
jgi:GNAT superfamily N-acetyltransferase